jgi:BlaI family penicillinase repressor
MLKLSDSEIYIMQIIWKYGKVTSFDILDEIKNDDTISENGIRTLLGRMVRKGAIRITEKKGKTYIYEALINKDDFLRKEGNNFLENIYQGAINSMLLNFVKENKLTKKDVQELLKRIDDESEN